jgi:hypothetical protein
MWLVCMVPPPHTHTCSSVQPEVFPSPPQRLYTGDCFRVEVPFDAPFCGAAVDVADVGGQQLLVQEFFGGAVDQLWLLLLLPVVWAGSSALVPGDSLNRPISMVILEPPTRLPRD